jgi:hypothetical protein
MRKLLNRKKRLSTRLLSVMFHKLQCQTCVSQNRWLTTQPDQSYVNCFRSENIFSTIRLGIIFVELRRTSRIHNSASAQKDFRDGPQFVENF